MVGPTSGNFSAAVTGGTKNSCPSGIQCPYRASVQCTCSGKFQGKEWYETKHDQCIAHVLIVGDLEMVSHLLLVLCCFCPPWDQLLALEVFILIGCLQPLGGGWIKLCWNICARNVQITIHLFLLILSSSIHQEIGHPPVLDWAVDNVA